MENSQFESWAIVELFGHTKYSGFISEKAIGGNTLLKLSVPAVKNEKVSLPNFEKLIHFNAIYAITPVSEEYALKMAEELSMQPIEGYNHESVIKQLAQNAFEQLKYSEIKKLVARNEALSKHGIEPAEDKPLF